MSTLNPEAPLNESITRQVAARPQSHKLSLHSKAVGTRDLLMVASYVFCGWHLSVYSQRVFNDIECMQHKLIPSGLETTFRALCLMN